MMKFEIGVRVGSKWYYTKAEDSYAALGCMREIGAELMVPEIDMDELVKSMASMLQGRAGKPGDGILEHLPHRRRRRRRPRGISFNPLSTGERPKILYHDPPEVSTWGGQSHSTTNSTGNSIGKTLRTFYWNSTGKKKERYHEDQ